MVDLGSGPGRFTALLGSGAPGRVALDLARTMLERVPAPGTSVDGEPYPRIDRVVGDALRVPLMDGRFSEVALLGNSLGFAGEAGLEMLEAAERLLAPGGLLLVEVAPGPGERSTYLSRLPPGAVGRLFEAPVRAVLPRIRREGFRPEPVRRASSEFVRWTPFDLERRWSTPDWQLLEIGAVAPALGPDPERLAAVAAHPRAWDRLLEAEETLGRDRDRWDAAAAVLIASQRTFGRHD